MDRIRSSLCVCFVFSLAVFCACPMNSGSPPDGNAEVDSNVGSDAGQLDGAVADGGFDAEHPDGAVADGGFDARHLDGGVADSPIDISSDSHTADGIDHTTDIGHDVDDGCGSHAECEGDPSGEVATAIRGQP